VKKINPRRVRVTRFHRSVPVRRRCGCTLAVRSHRVVRRRSMIRAPARDCPAAGSTSARESRKHDACRCAPSGARVRRTDNVDRVKYARVVRRPHTLSRPGCLPTAEPTMDRIDRFEDRFVSAARCKCDSVGRVFTAARSSGSIWSEYRAQTSTYADCVNAATRL
jgi:hypothetical protein